MPDTKIYSHLRVPGIYAERDGLTYKWNFRTWEPCMTVPPDDDFRIPMPPEDYPVLYRSIER